MTWGLLITSGGSFCWCILPPPFFFELKECAGVSTGATEASSEAVPCCHVRGAILGSQRVAFGCVKMRFECTGLGELGGLFIQVCAASYIIFLVCLASVTASSVCTLSLSCPQFTTYPLLVYHIAAPFSSLFFTSITTHFSY